MIEPKKKEDSEGHSSEKILAIGAILVFVSIVVVFIIGAILFMRR